MPGPYDKFEASFETFTEEIRKMLTEFKTDLDDLKKQRSSVAPGTVFDTDLLITEIKEAVRSELETFREGFLEELSTTLEQSRQHQPQIQKEHPQTLWKWLITPH